jgi:UDP-N-acetyl-D-glucosamine/UDP-N-acetyl-D-galactosamine dehydrogenase
MINEKNTKIAIIGLGYVGLPLAVEFGKIYDTVGFDINEARINELLSGYDSTLEVDSKELIESSKIIYTSNASEINNCNIYIITVPTPIDDLKKPDLGPLISACKLVGSILKKHDIVIFESTVFPGATEEVCVPILEKSSGLKFNTDFSCGYSPERINPGDKKHQLTSIKKITSGSNPIAANTIDELYNKIISAGTHKADSIKIAEAAKVIENTQRDINIALINELAMIFNKLNINTEKVLEAAGTKWNFLPFKPGLVGGHCIGVDPYYLTFKAIESGYNPKMILAGRRLNDNMSSYIVDQVSKLMIQKSIKILSSNVLIMGLTFKENCPDIRNSKVVDLIIEFKKIGCNVDVYDPWVNHEKALTDYNILPINEPKINNYDAIIIAVKHKQFQEITLEKFKGFGKNNHVLYDVKYLFEANQVDGRL